MRNDIVIRPIADEDTKRIVAWRNNPRVRGNFIFRETFTEEMHQNWMATKVASGEVEQFVIEWDSRPVGSVYLRDIDLQQKCAEYGIFIGEDDAIGKGIGSYACKWAVEYSRKQLGLERLILRVFADNAAAAANYRGAGFTETERLKEYMDGRDLLMMECRLTDMPQQ